MAIKKSTYTGGSGRAMLHSPYVANTPAETIVEHAFTEALAADDILELAYLPAYCKILSVELASTGTGATTFDVGFMDGRVGSPDPARTCGDELFAGATPTTKAEAEIPALAALKVSDADRSIGVTASAAVAANPATKLFMRIRYAKGGQ